MRQPLEQEDTDYLRVLEEAITDVGVWSWWDMDWPEVVQLEFDWVQLMTPRLKPDAAPSGTVALLIYDPSYLVFTQAQPPEWYQLLRQGKHDPLRLAPGSLQFAGETPPRDAAGYVWAESRATVPERMPVSVRIQVGEYGVFVGGERLVVKDMAGVIALSELPSRAEAWWQYLEEYWEKRGTAQALPIDPACEATIPGQ